MSPVELKDMSGASHVGDILFADNKLHVECQI